MKKIFFQPLSLISLCLLFACCAPDLVRDCMAKELVFEGKASAQVVREVSVPFPVVVDEVFVGIGDRVEEGQKLLQYHLLPKELRGIQHELSNAAGEADWRSRESSLEQEIIAQSSKTKLSSELAAKNLGPQSDAALNAKALRLAQTRAQALKRQEQTAKSDFAIRLKELESYLGHKLKPGQKLPQELFMTAPLAGTIISMSTHARPLSQLAGVAFTIAILNPIQIQFLVHESEITSLYVGQKAVIEMASDKKKTFTGTVSMLSWQPTDAAVATPSFYRVWVDADNPDQFLKPGYKVLVHVDLGDN